MLRSAIKEKLETNHIWYEESDSDWVRVQCMNPEHDDKHPSAGINVDTGLHHCFSCQFNFMYLESGDVDPDMLWRARYKGLKFLEVVEKDVTEFTLPPIGHLLNTEWRGLSGELLQDVGAYYCNLGKYQGRNVFPIYMDNILMGFDARIVDATARLTGAKWVRPKNMQVKDIVYPSSVLKKMDCTHIIITEGLSDALSYIQLGYAAIPSFGLSPPSLNRITEMVRLGCESVTIAFDNDEAGLAGTAKVWAAYAEWFDVKMVPIVETIKRSGGKDANEYLKRSNNEEHRN